MKRYEQYKDSGIDWIGELPSHWNFSKLKWFSTIYAGGTPDTNNDSYWQNGSIPWLNSGTVNQKRIKEASAFITEEALNKSSTKWVPKNSLLMALAGQGKTKGTTALLEIDATCNQSMAAIIPSSEKMDSEYLYYYLDSNYSRIRGLAGDEQRDGLNLEIIGNIFCPIPVFEEQKKISKYLNKKTAAIDTLIKQKETLLEKLQQKRQAIINEAVTKGLPGISSPSGGGREGAMKDSGIEWLGQIPAHWEVKKLKYVLDFYNHIRVPLSAEERGQMKEQTYDYYGASGVIDKVDNYLFDGEFILVGEDGANLLTRSTALAFKASGKFWVNNHAHILMPKYGNIDYFVSLLECIDFTTYISGSAQPKLTMENLANIFLTVPPQEEQTRIADFVMMVTNKIGTVEKNISIQIEKLNTYRQSLISEVVTGKVKVTD